MYTEYKLEVYTNLKYILYRYKCLFCVSWFGREWDKTYPTYPSPRDSKTKTGAAAAGTPMYKVVTKHINSCINNNDAYLYFCTESFCFVPR